MPAHEKIVVITKKTALEELVERFNTQEQARFYLEQMGVSFTNYQAAHNTYQEARQFLQKSLPQGVRVQWIDREFLPTFTFGREDLIVTLGPDGLVVNAAKYLDGQPLLAFNPDPRLIDGVLLPFVIWQAELALKSAVRGAYQVAAITMAQATLNDGQNLLALNDLFIGAKTHVSARYEITCGSHREAQLSSGIIVTTGAGSTGWWRSILTGAAEITQVQLGAVDVQAAKENYRFNWSANELRFAVREPFISKTSAANLVCGTLPHGQMLEIVSRMPQNGVIFSDGVEEDFLEFNAGAIATIGVAEKKLRLITGL